MSPAHHAELRMRYLSIDGSAAFVFGFAEVPGRGWRAYVRATPGPPLAASELSATHRHLDRRGAYVCWTRPIPTLAHCQRIAALWAEGLLHYRATGSFDIPPAALRRARHPTPVREDP